MGLTPQRLIHYFDTENLLYFKTLSEKHFADWNEVLTLGDWNPTSVDGFCFSLCCSRECTSSLSTQEKKAARPSR